MQAAAGLRRDIGEIPAAVTALLAEAVAQGLLRSGDLFLTALNAIPADMPGGSGQVC